MVIHVIAAASGAAAKIVPAIAAASGAASKIVPAVAAASSAAKAAHGAIKLIPAAVKLVPVVGTAAVGVGKVTAAITAAITAATAIVGIGKLTILPVLLASMAFYNYDLFDPENRPFNVKVIDSEYDFVIVGGWIMFSVDFASGFGLPSASARISKLQ